MSWLSTPMGPSAVKSAVNSSTNRAKTSSVARMEYGPVQMQMAATLAMGKRSPSQLESRAHAAVTISSSPSALSARPVAVRKELGLVQMQRLDCTLAIRCRTLKDQSVTFLAVIHSWSPEEPSCPPVSLDIYVTNSEYGNVWDTRSGQLIQPCQTL